MRSFVVRSGIVAVACMAAIFLQGCGESRTVPAAPQSAPLAQITSASEGAAAKPCSPQQTQGQKIDLVQPAALSTPLVLGTPAQVTLEITVVSTNHGNNVHGPLVQPISLKLLDPRGHVTMSCNVVWDTRYEPVISSDGYGDAFTITAKAAGQTYTWNLSTSLPKDIPLSTRSPQIWPAFLRFGSDGNMWAPVDAEGLSVLRIRPNGRTDIFTSPDTQLQIPIKQLLPGGDGNLWIAFKGNGGTGMVRITTSGTFTEFPLPAADSDYTISAFAWAKNRFVVGVQTGYKKAAILGFDERGNYRQLAALHAAPVSFVTDHDSNVWFTMDAGVRPNYVRLGKLTPSGQISLYRVCCVQNMEGAASLVLGPDGKIWLPYLYGTRLLLKVGAAGTVVSRQTLPYSAPWATNGPEGPRIADYARDGRGNLYAADRGFNGSAFGGSGVIRFAKGGGVTEYPVFRPFGGDPQAIAYDAKTAHLYIANTYYVPNKYSEGSIVAVDPKYW